MARTVRMLFALSFGFGVVLSVGALIAPLNPWIGLWGFVVAAIVSGFEEGDKTKPQMLFATIATALALSILQFAFNPWWWAGVAVFVFLVLTMKIDGGDNRGG